MLHDRNQNIYSIISKILCNISLSQCRYNLLYTSLKEKICPLLVSSMVKLDKLDLWPSSRWAPDCRLGHCILPSLLLNANCNRKEMPPFPAWRRTFQKEETDTVSLKPLPPLSASVCFCLAGVLWPNTRFLQCQDDEATCLAQTLLVNNSEKQ